jgi:hypothetical protein
MNPTEFNQVKPSTEKLLRLTIKGTYRGNSTSPYRINDITEDERVSYKEKLKPLWNIYKLSISAISTSVVKY